VKETKLFIFTSMVLVVWQVFVIYHWIFNIQFLQTFEGSIFWFGSIVFALAFGVSSENYIQSNPTPTAFFSFFRYLLFGTTMLVILLSILILTKDFS
jgi:hypothetical protein